MLKKTHGICQVKDKEGFCLEQIKKNNTSAFSSHLYTQHGINIKAIDSPIKPSNSFKLKEDSCPLEFYRNYWGQYPFLVKVIRKLFCITTTSVPSEELFSKAELILTELRIRIQP